MRIDRELLDRVIDHARSEAPNECCGLIGVRDGRVASVRPAVNIAASPLRFEVEPRDLVRHYMAIEDDGEELGAIYHSHTRTAPYPSPTDVNFSYRWPGVEWLIVGLEGDAVEVRSYAIEDGRIDEVPVDVL